MVRASDTKKQTRRNITTGKCWMDLFIVVEELGNSRYVLALIHTIHPSVSDVIKSC